MKTEILTRDEHKIVIQDTIEETKKEEVAGAEERKILKIPIEDKELRDPLPIKKVVKTIRMIALMSSSVHSKQKTHLLEL